MSGDKLISVVIPIYNGEKYIHKAIECLKKQSYHDFEVILVDDQSTDGSALIAMQVAEEDARFKYYLTDEKCGTAFKSASFGLKKTTGNYYFFMSQDDFIDFDFFEKGIKRIQETGAQVALPDMIWYREGTNNLDGIFPPGNNHSTILTPEEAFLKSIHWGLHGFSIRSMELIKNCTCPYLLYNSEEYIARKSYAESNKVVFFDSKFYYRQDNPNAITKKRHFFDVDILFSEVLLLEIMKKHGIGGKLYWSQTVKKLGRMILTMPIYFKFCRNSEERKYVSMREAEMWKEYFKILFMKRGTKCALGKK